MAQKPAVIKLSSRPTQQFWEISILYEDDQLLALDKPGCLLISPDRFDPGAPNLMALLHGGIAEGKPWAKERELGYLMNAHRLEAEMSGALLLAKAKPAFLELVNGFGAGKFSQKLVALVQGAPAQDHFEVQAKIAPDPARPGCVRIDARRGKASRTTFTVMEKFAGFTLLECELLTNRSHQIRVHLRSVGLRLAGDSLYGGKPLLLSGLKREYRLKLRATERPLLDRAALHGAELGLPHPLTGQALTITAPLPKDLSVALKYLRRYAKG